MPQDLRCPSRMHGRFTDKFIIEVKCDSRKCGASKQVIILHKFDLVTRELISTERYRNPGSQR